MYTARYLAKKNLHRIKFHFESNVKLKSYSQNLDWILFSHRLKDSNTIYKNKVKKYMLFQKNCLYQIATFCVSTLLNKINKITISVIKIKTNLHESLVYM